MENSNHLTYDQLVNYATDKYSPEWAYALACCFRDGEGIDPDYYQYRFYLQLAARRGAVLNSEERALLGLEPDPVAKTTTPCSQPQSSLPPIAQDSLPDDPDELFIIGYRYYYGIEEYQDYAKAVPVLTMAAQEGQPYAQLLLGYCHFNGRGVPYNKSIAYGWFLRAAEQDNTQAQACVGDCLNYGEGVAQDWNEAVNWYYRAAVKGHSNAQYALGIAYMNGRGVVQNYRYAIHWLWLAAEQGHPDAQCELGWAYMKGYGVDANERIAIEWYRRAAVQSHQPAIEFLNAQYPGRDIARLGARKLEPLVFAAAFPPPPNAEPIEVRGISRRGPVVALGVPGFIVSIVVTAFTSLFFVLSLLNRREMYGAAPTGFILMLVNLLCGVPSGISLWLGKKRKVRFALNKAGLIISIIGASMSLVILLGGLIAG